MTQDSKPSADSFVNRPKVSFPALIVALAITALFAYAFFA